MSDVKPRPAMKVVVVRVDEQPEVVTVTPDLETLQALVGGYLELLPVPGYTIYVNDNAAGLPFNRTIAGFPVCGDAVVLGPPDGQGYERALSADDVARVVHALWRRS